MQGFNSILMFLGRIGLSSIFLLGGAHKLMNFDFYQKLLSDRGFQYVPIVIVIVALIELIGALFLLLGWKTRWGAVLLLLYLIPTTIIMHNFWDVTEPVLKDLQILIFFKNSAIIGGLLYVLSFSAGSISIDRFLKKKEPTT